MSADKDREPGPLSSEAMKREEWRGGETILQKEDVSGHTPPASEGDAAELNERSEGTHSPARTIAPPD